MHKKSFRIFYANITKYKLPNITKNKLIAKHLIVEIGKRVKTQLKKNVDQ